VYAIYIATCVRHNLDIVRGVAENYLLFSHFIIVMLQLTFFSAIAREGWVAAWNIELYNVISVTVNYSR
jgi:hypothetical protein